MINRLALLNSLNIVDAILTTARSYKGRFSEANPLMLTLIEINIVVFIVAKVLIVAVVTGFALAYAKNTKPLRASLDCMIALYALAIIGNTAEMMS